MGGPGSGGPRVGAGRRLRNHVQSAPTSTPRVVISNGGEGHELDIVVSLDCDQSRQSGNAQRKHFARQAVMYRNELTQATGLLTGIAAGLVADRVLNDEEIRFLHGWLAAHDELACAWPGDIVFARVRSVMADGIITEGERAHLIQTLQDLIGKPDTLTAAVHVTELAFDDVPTIEFTGQAFCLTGNFVYAPRDVCEHETARRGGILKSGVSKKVRYVVAGSLGSQEWKYGSWGTKIDKAMQLKREGAPILVVREDQWAAAL